jgi:hypothetical protein
LAGGEKTVGFDPRNPTGWFPSWRYDINSPYYAVYKPLIPEALRVEARRLIKYGAEAKRPQPQDIKSPFVL